jgi:ATP-binding cassette subfamily B protein
MFATIRSFRRPFAMLRRHWFAVVVGVVMVAGFCVCKLWIARIIGETIDALDVDAGDTEATRGQLLHVVFLLIGVIAVEAACRFLARRLIIDSSREIEARLKSDLMAHVGRLPLTWYDSARTGDLLSRMTQDVELVRFLIGPSILYGAQSLVMVPGCIYMMADLSTSVTLAIAGAFAALLIAMMILMPRLQKFSKAVQEDIAAISHHAQESFGGIHVLFHFAKASVFGKRFDELNETYVRDNMAMTRFRALVNLFVHLCTDLVILTVLVLGAIEVIGGRLTTGGLFQFIILMGFLVWPLIAMGWILGTVHRARSAADRIEEVLATVPESTGGKTVELRGDLSVRDLTFCYPGEETNALQNVDFELPAGQKLGLVGRVGSGKSTLLHLILRLYDPPRGTIFIDGHDVLDLDLSCLRQMFAFAPQEPFLFSDTVSDNVRFGLRNSSSPESDREAVFAAVRSSALEQDVESLSEGLETIVGERGVTLSGGQKQRVALARALVADRGTVMLDDTLSAVDHQTEVRILDRLREARTDRTLIIASHRLSAIADADLILVLHDGEVVERGDHKALVRRDGEYARAWCLQREERALGGEPPTNPRGEN